LSIMNAAIAGLPDPGPKIWELWGCLEEPDGDGGLCTCNVTTIFDNNTAAGCVKVAMKSSNSMISCIIYRGQ
jgi:hypothetical protein